MENIFSPILQLGFAAFSLCQLVLIYLLIKEFVLFSERITILTVSIQKLTDKIVDFERACHERQNCRGT